MAVYGLSVSIFDIFHIDINALRCLSPTASSNIVPFIEVGDTIRATGDPDAEDEDGVVTATSIQLGDLGLGRFGGRPGAAGGTDETN